MRVRNKAWAFALAAAAGLVLAMWIWSRTDASAWPRLVDGSSPAAADGAIDLHSVSPPARGDKVLQVESLKRASSTGTPLPELWERLTPPARAGDASAACRLALLTLRCESEMVFLRFKAPWPDVDVDGELQALQAFISDPSGQLAEIARGAPDSPQIRAGEQEHKREVQARCGPLEPSRRSEALSFLRQAALAGIPGAQVAYVSWAGGALPGSMSDPVFDRWLEEAPTILSRMLAAGDPQAPRLLAEAYSREGMLGWLYPYDPVRSVASAELLARLGDRNRLQLRVLDARRDALTPAERAEARRLADHWFTEHYADRPSPGSGSRWQQPGETMPIRPDRFDADRACATTGGRKPM